MHPFGGGSRGNRQKNGLSEVGEGFVGWPNRRFRRRARARKTPFRAFARMRPARLRGREGPDSAAYEQINAKALMVAVFLCLNDRFHFAAAVTLFKARCATVTNS